jgi:hypothetical protein
MVPGAAIENCQVGFFLAPFLLVFMCCTEITVELAILVKGMKAIGGAYEVLSCSMLEHRFHGNKEKDYEP